MAKKHETDRWGFRLDPQDVSKWVWYYEERKGLCVIVQQPAEGGGIVPIPAFTVPWRLVEKSVDRYRRNRSRQARRVAKRPRGT
jgi:hypothetical protein